MNLVKFIAGLPKAELHLHIEGTLNPELMFKLAERNKIELKYKSVEELRNAYNFGNLQDFLNLYYAGAGVLRVEEDFYEMTLDYLERAHSHRVLHCEIFFDPQTHTSRGINFDTVINGIDRAIKDAKKNLGISAKLIMCFLRDQDENSAIKTMKEALRHREKIIGVGLDSAEVGNPPSKFKNVFDLARREGLLTVAHAGEEGPAEYVWEALKYLNVSRIDHGNNSIHDNALMEELVRSQIPLTLCPLSNLKLRVVDDLKKHPLRKMLQKNIVATINSDDPAYFGGYINENYREISLALELSKNELRTLAKNSFRASFLDEEEKLRLTKEIDDYADNYSDGN